MKCCAAVVIFLCLLSAEAAYGSVTKGTHIKAFNRTIQLIRNEISNALSLLLGEPGQLPNISCLSLNTTGLAVPEQQLFTAHHLFSFRCNMLQMSNLTLKLSKHLLMTSQYIHSLENPRGRGAVCNLPPLEPTMDYYVHVKCMLELLYRQLSKAKF